MNSSLIVIAAGGTGGHMFPAQALAEELLARGWRVKLSTDARGARYTDGFPDAVEIDVIKAATFSRGGIKAKLTAPFSILAGIFGAWWNLRKDRPALVAGFGGYPTLPAMFAAGMLRVPRLIHEQNGVLGRVNQFFAKKVNMVACGTWPTLLPEGVEGVHVGNPPRAAIKARAGADYISPGDWPMNLLVIGGSQGSSIVSQVAAQAITLLPKPFKERLRVAMQVREADLPDVEQVFTNAGLGAELQPFFKSIPSRMSEAQLVISRAGASSLGDLTVIGRPSILIPLKIATKDHQTANAQGLIDAQAATVISEDDLTPERLAKEIVAILNKPKHAEKMAQNALGLGRPNAASDLADYVEQLAQKGS